MCDFGEGRMQAMKHRLLQEHSASFVKFLLVTKKVITMKDFHTFLDMRRNKN